MGAEAGQVGGGSDPPRTPASGQKRKRVADPPAGTPSNPAIGRTPTIPTNLADDTPLSKSKTKKAKKPKLDASPVEKRLRRFRAEPPQSFFSVYERATSQRFYVLNRTRCGTADCPEEMVELAGSTGNVYTVVIDRQPSCNCPHARSGNQCKHVLYVMSRVLRASFAYTYQLALLATELRDIFAHAPAPAGDAEKHGNRKPVEGDCPICFGELRAAGAESVVWCRAACGQNIHAECFEMWAATKRRQGGVGTASEVTCPFCRSVWHGDEDMVKKIKMTGKVNHEGYANVADQLGISSERDTSTYSKWWHGHGRRNRYYGSYDDDEDW